MIPTKYVYSCHFALVAFQYIFSGYHFNIHFLDATAFLDSGYKSESVSEEVCVSQIAGMYIFKHKNSFEKIDDH